MPYEFLNNPQAVNSGLIYDIRKPGSLYSGNEERTDIYGASMPIRTGQVMGNMYGPGPNYMSNRQIITPPTHTQMPYAFQPQTRSQFDSGSKNPSQENFTLDYTSPSASTPIEADYITNVSPKKYNIPLIFIMILFLFAAMFYWIKSGNLVISKYIFKGRPAEAWHYLVFAILATFIFSMIFYFGGYSTLINQ